MIKIRMWDKPATAMVYNQVLIYKLLAGQAAFDNPNDLKEIEPYANVTPTDYGGQYTFMPYTGVNDQTGKHIYTGDYVRIIWPHWHLCFVVKQERGAFVLHNPHLRNMQQFPVLSNYMQIVGNIFETPDLQLSTSLN